MSELDLSDNGELQILDYINNQLPSLDLSHNPKLTELFCDGNGISSMDVSRLQYLTELACANNQLTSLDVSRNRHLKVLRCWDNRLAELDLSNQAELEEVNCDRNSLTELNLHNGSIESDVKFEGNPALEWICADEEQVEAIKDIANGYDYGSCVVTSNCQRLSIEDASGDYVDLSFYPNPVKNILYIKGDIKVEKIEVFDMAGKLIKTITALSGNQVDLSSLEKGAYLVNIYWDKVVATGRIVKE